MNKPLLLLLLFVTLYSCADSEPEVENTAIQNNFEPQIITSNENVQLDSIPTQKPSIITQTIIQNELETKLPNTFKLRTVSPQNPGIGVLESNLHEYVEPGNKEITFFFIKTIYESKEQTLDSHLEAIINSPRTGSDRKLLEKIILNEQNWLYEQYEMNEPDGTPVTYDDFIFINADIMYGMTACCNSVNYSKWKSVIEKAKEGLMVL